MNNASKELIKSPAKEMWYWARDKQKSYCDKTGCGKIYTEDFDELRDSTQHAWLLAAGG